MHVLELTFLFFRFISRYNSVLLCLFLIEEIFHSGSVLVLVDAILENLLKLIDLPPLFEGNTIFQLSLYV